MMYADVSRAYFHAESSREVYVKLPEEDWEAGDELRCGKLNVSMYGTRDAALNWAEEYAGELKKAGYRRGVANPCLFWHRKKKVTIMVHGDDFVAVGEEEGLQEARRVLEDAYNTKVETLGDGDGGKQEIRVLNKVIRNTKEGTNSKRTPGTQKPWLRVCDCQGQQQS